jgi:carboxypeptidase Taq
MNDSFNALNQLIGEVTDLQHAASLIEWDEQVTMPSAGAEVHGQMLATIRKLAHQKFTAPEIGRTLEDLKQALNGADRDSDASRSLDVTAHEFDKAVRVPADFVAEQAKAASAAQHAWIAARSASNFAVFQPHLAKLVELRQRYVEFFPPAAHPYDIVLDDFEPGMTTAEVLELFAVLRPRQVALLRAIAARPQVDDSFLQAPFAEAELAAFATEVVSAMGFDWQRGRQDRSVHPFATAVGPNDVRITSRYVEREPLSLVFGMVHEAGHALYEQGIDASFTRTLLGNAASLGVHESQSRLWENLVGRSRAFWEHFYPALQQRFPGQLGHVPLDPFYRGINKVTPSLIRVESDEATYNLHIMLRVELEIALLDGTLRVPDLPDAWNARMRDYLGVTPSDDAHGVLQDIHWSIGLFGYFATYTLGNVISAQLWGAYRRANPERDNELCRGEFGPLLSWLRGSIHKHGRKFPPQELVERATGARITPEPYLRYLESKYGEIYAL